MISVLGKHEQFETDVLERLKKGKFLDFLVFGGGTMLRLCHELPRYSVDLDFWFAKKKDFEKVFFQLGDFLKKYYQTTDAKNKHFTLLYELKRPISERRLKIEIRKEIVTKGVESKIAFSRFSTQQVLVNALSLSESAKRKIQAMHSRHEIRDFFDLEFLLRCGAEVSLEKKEKVYLEKRVKDFKKTDYSVSLGSLLEKKLREHYIRHGFSHLKNFLSY